MNPSDGRPLLTVEPVTLEGDLVRLEPLSLGHVKGLWAVGLDPEIWRWMPVRVSTLAEMRALIEAALVARADGHELPFATIERASGRPVGSTRYLNIELRHRRLEIGWTWIAPPWQRTALNTEAKLLQLEHAFERLGCQRVEFKTDSLNEQSRLAIMRLGAVEEGILRNHMVVQDGRLRHTVYYSILDTEWPAVKARLLERLGR